jgi:hypothetical protein
VDAGDLMTASRGSLDLGVAAAARLPFHSMVLGGLALVAVVALPAMTLAWLAACGHRRTADTSIVAGILLAGWILVELAFIRELSFFHPVYFVLGILLIWAGATTRRHEAGHSKADDEQAA